MARPRVKAALITDWLADRPGATAREVAHGLQLSVRDASKTLDRLRIVGEVAVLDRVRVEHAKRPVAVYGRAPVRCTEIFSDDWIRRDN